MYVFLVSTIATRNLLLISWYSSLKTTTASVNRSFRIVFFSSPCDVVLTLWTLYRRQNDDVVCLLGYKMSNITHSFYFMFYRQKEIIFPYILYKVLCNIFLTCLQNALLINIFLFFPPLWYRQFLKYSSAKITYND